MCVEKRRSSTLKFKLRRVRAFDIRTGWFLVSISSLNNPIIQRLGGLGVWFSLRVREVPGSIPGQAHFTKFCFLLYLFFRYATGCLSVYSLVMYMNTYKQSVKKLNSTPEWMLEKRKRYWDKRLKTKMIVNCFMFGTHYIVLIKCINAFWYFIVPLDCNCIHPFEDNIS